MYRKIPPIDPGTWIVGIFGITLWVIWSLSYVFNWHMPHGSVALWLGYVFGGIIGCLVLLYIWALGWTALEWLRLRFPAQDTGHGEIAPQNGAQSRTEGDLN